ncbi:ATP-binding protein [candidate division KSB1 bacterium]|nr:ATP-binding protein [candidate division KSB1 bacterium]RQW00566.1 MAG: ATP-binding protein [candidate division KSB1 bacterium]
MNELVQTERFRENGLKLTPASRRSDTRLVIELMSLFEKYEKEGFRIFALDVQSLSDLSEDLIVLMLEVSARLRRSGGDLYVYNLHYDLLEDVLTFNPKHFLTIAEDSSDAGGRDKNKVRIAPSSERKSPLPNKALGKSINRIEIPYNEDEVYKACDFVLSRAKRMGFTENELSRMKIAVYEACLNAIQHTRKMSPGEKVIVEVETNEHAIQINVYDRGFGFDPRKTKEFNVTEAVSHRKTGGMGLHIIRRAMDEVDYQADRLNGNKLVMKKYLSR